MEDYSTNAALDSANTFFSPAFFLIGAILIVVLIVALWKLFVKAGQPGWASLIPIYNTYVLLKIVGRPAWWLLLFFIPYLNIIPTIIVSIDLAKSFGKSTLFGVVGLVIFSLVGYIMLAFGDAKYQGPSVGKPAPAPAATPPATPPAAS
jgi:hypothetical protein